MLCSLRINGFAIVDQLQVDFKSGFNVITGETGSGKSILIKALDLLRGEKGNSSLIKPGCSELEIEAKFCLDGKGRTQAYLDHLEIPYDLEPHKEHLTLRRVIDKRSRSQIWANDILISMVDTRALANFLLDIFAQHASHQLLDEKNHTAFFDQFLPDQSVVLEYSRAYDNMQEKVNALEALLKDYSQKSKQEDFLKFRLEQLDALDPKSDDYDMLKASCVEGEQNSQLQKNLDMIDAAIGEQDGAEETLQNKWAGLLKICDRLKQKHPKLSELSDIARQITQLSNDFSYSLARLQASSSFDLEAFETAQKRLAAYQELFRKFSVGSVDELVAMQSGLRAELEFLEQAKVLALDLISALKKLGQGVEKAAARLTEARESTAEALETRIHAHLVSLGMPRARLKVTFFPYAASKGKALDLATLGRDFAASQAKSWGDILRILHGHGEAGAQKVLITVSTNPEQELASLAKIASGGEASRLLLACHNSFEEQAREHSLIFDEIDNGISGKIAAKVGRKIKESSKRGQIICISHLAQVAAFADHHIGIEKVQSETDTKVKCTYFDKKGRIREIAKLLSGEKVTAVSLANAQALLEH